MKKIFTLVTPETFPVGREISVEEVKEIAGSMAGAVLSDPGTTASNFQFDDGISILVNIEED